MIPRKERSAAAIRTGSIAARVSGGRHRNAQPHEGVPLRAGRWARWRDVTRAAGRYTPIKVFTVIAALVAPINVQSCKRRRRETPLLPLLLPPPVHEADQVFPAGEALVRHEHLPLARTALHLDPFLARKDEWFPAHA